MHLSSRTVRVLLEAAEAAGIARGTLADGVFDLALLSTPHDRIDWAKLVVVMERLSGILGGDAERLREVGANILRAPSYEFLRRFARNVFSLRALYKAGLGWLAPSLFPHVPLSTDFHGDRRVRFEGNIPEPHAASEPFFYIFEGCVRELPHLLALPRATIQSSRITARTVATVLEMPASQSLSAGIRQTVRALFGGAERIELLEEQRRELVRGVTDLRRISDELQALLDALPDPVTIHREGKILWVNRALLGMLGYERPEELVGKSVLDITDESSQRSAMERLVTPLHAQPELMQMQLRRRDGELVIVELSSAQKIVFSGLEARVIVGRDVTERVRMQERLVTADRLSSLGMLAAGVAHEINNPLAYVLGSIENARRSLDAPRPDVEGAREALATALEGVDRVRTIVRDLRDLSRADEHTVQAVDVRAVLDSTLMLAGSEIVGRVRIVRDYGAVPDARMNAARLGQVFLNLVVNALESMAERDPRDSELRVRTATDEARRVVIEVSDNGEGIAPGLLSRIFDPFFTTRPTGRGTGLGLAICHRITSEAGGEISVESTPGIGSTFRITLPAADPSAS